MAGPSPSRRTQGPALTHDFRELGLGARCEAVERIDSRPGQLRCFLDEVLGSADDITQIEYLKSNNREYGTALVGIEIGSATGLHSLLERTEALRIDYE